MLIIKLHHCRSLETDICLWKRGDKPGSASGHSGYYGPCRIWCWITRHGDCPEESIFFLPSTHLRLANTHVGLNNKYPGTQAQKRAFLLPQYRHSSQIWLIEIMHRTKSPVWWDLTKMIMGWNCLSLIPTILRFNLQQDWSKLLQFTAPDRW